jgi:hypothetical protein
MTTYLMPMNRDFSVGHVGDEIIAANEWQIVDSGFKEVAGHPHLIDGATFGIGDHALQWIEPAVPVDCYVVWETPFQYIYPKLYGRLYLSLSDLPTGAWRLIEVQKQDTSPIVSLRIESDGHLRWYSGADGATAVGSESEIALPEATDLRIEYGIEFSATAAGRAEARFFYGDLHDTKPTEALIASGFQTAGATSGNRVKMGMFNGTGIAAGTTLTFDGMNANVVGFPGAYELLYHQFEMGDLIYPEFAPITDNAGDPDNTLWTYLRGIGRMMQEVRDVSKDGLNGEPGWSQVLDATRVRPQWVPWLAQMAGYYAPVYQTKDDEAAYLGRQIPRIKKFSSWNRGSVESMRYAVQEHLWGTQNVIVQERYGGDPNQIRVYFYNSEIATSSTAAMAAAVSQKAAGLLFAPEGTPGAPILLDPNTYNVLNASNASYNEVNSQHPNYNDVLVNTAV